MQEYKANKEPATIKNTSSNELSIDFSELKKKSIQYLTVKIIPQSNKNELYEKMEDGSYKIRIKAIPEKGKANEELIKFLSKLSGIPKSGIHIISGSKERKKLIKFSSEHS